MSRATKLVFTNRFRYRKRPRPRLHANLRRHHTSVSDALDDRMMLSIGVSFGPEDTPTELAVQVPLAIHSAGFSITEVELDFSTPPGLFLGSTWVHQKDRLPGLKAAAESLKVFTFKNGAIKRSPSEEISTSVSTYLRAVLGAGAGNIQALKLLPDFSFSSLDLDRPYKGHWALVGLASLASSPRNHSGQLSVPPQRSEEFNRGASAWSFLRSQAYPPAQRNLG